MAGLTFNLQGNHEPVQAKESRGTAARLTDDARGSKKVNQRGLALLEPRGDKVAEELVANVGKNPTLSPTPAMADLTHNLPGNQVPLHAEVTRTSEKRLSDYTGGAMNGNKQGLASRKPCGDKIANKAMANISKSPTLSLTSAIADLTHNLPGKQVPLHAKETRASEEYWGVYARGSKNGNNQGLLLLNPGGNIIANKVTTNKKMDDRVRNGNQLHAERLDLLLARLEQKRARGKPSPKRGDVTKAIVEAGVKKLIDTGKAFCCAPGPPGPFDVDAFVRDLPIPTRSEPTGTLWAEVEV